MRKNQTLVYERNKRILYQCNQIFPGNNRIHLSVETYTYHHNDCPQGTSVDGWRKTEDRMSKVSPESFRSAMSRRAGQG